MNARMLYADSHVSCQDTARFVRLDTFFANHFFIIEILGEIVGHT